MEPPVAEKFEDFSGVTQNYGLQGMTLRPDVSKKRVAFLSKDFGPRTLQSNRRGLLSHCRSVACKKSGIL